MKIKIKPEHNDATQLIIYRCKCGKEGRALHPCPFNDEILSDKKLVCHCCQACEDECNRET